MSSDQTPSLSATAVFGLAAKIQKLFTDSDHIVSIPVTPPAYSAESLQFAGAENATAHENTLAELSELCNRIPTIPLWGPTAGAHLWEIYGEILGAQLAKSNLSPDEQRRYDLALAYLYGPDGSNSLSHELEEYSSAQQAWQVASAAYQGAQGAASASSDPGVKSQWQHVDEPRLRAARDNAWNAWLSAGHKAQVEDSIRVVTELGAKNPAAVWTRHRNAFDPALPGQLSTAPNEISYAPTYFTPGEIIKASWPRIEISRDELAKLAADAVPQVKVALDGTIDDKVTSLAFDYSLVSLERPWLDPPMELFGSRAWKFPASTQPLSDGGTPPSGRCPTYVESLVLVRQIQTVSVDGKELRSGETVLPAGGTFDFDSGTPGGSRADVLWFQPSKPGEIGPYLGPINNAMNMSIDPPQDFDEVGPARLYRAVGPPYHGDPLRYQGGIMSTGDPNLLDGTIVAFKTTDGNFAKVQILDCGESVKIRWTTYAVTSDPQSTDPSEIYIAAFVCRQLPKCPNPDPSLSW